MMSPQAKTGIAATHPGKACASISESDKKITSNDSSPAALKKRVFCIFLDHTLFEAAKYTAAPMKNSHARGESAK